MVSPILWDRSARRAAFTLRFPSTPRTTREVLRPTHRRRPCRPAQFTFRQTWVSTLRRGSASLYLFLGSVGPAPKRTRVDAIGIDFQHRVVEFARGLGCRIQPIEIAKVLPRLGNNMGIVVILWHLVPGHHRSGFQGLKPLECGDPLKPALCV